MRTEKNAGKLNMQVTEGLAVAVYPNHEHEFLLPTKEVALGYGSSAYSIRMAKKRHSDELIEGKHFLSNVTICHGASKGSSRATMWTKRGIVRLGFFIKSERAKLFRDWAEDLIIKVDEHKDLFGQIASTPPKLPQKRNHNRLTQARLVDLMADVVRIENADLRLSITKKLGL
ncbi:hypothetical protein KO504_16925 [Winogradskyella psychrotolerans]|uniref:hypothetical protein n=1 Tax=Winogradskyella psychrotolerans TaxID=1344585 RepID=UPI001C072B06|nr:hypothetical protein [Winogradskyella psychrotolerans]MBU2923035.1 hypothetical protein [Winogradskyella psychrotolerans]